MVIDSKGNILTNMELKRMMIKEITVNVNDTHKLMKHFDGLIETIENTSECAQANKKFVYYLGEIKSLLPKDKKYLSAYLEDSCNEILVLHEEYFYKSGYYDSLKSKGFLKRILLMVLKKDLKWF